MYLCYSRICVTGTYQTDKFWTLEDDGEFWGIEKTVAVTDGDEVKCCGGGWGWKPCLMGTDGDGYNFCGNGWEWLDFPLPCRSLRHNWKLAHVVNSHLVCDPTIWQLGFYLPRQQWSLLNREQGHCGACRRKWRLTDWSVSIRWDLDHVPHYWILSSDKAQ